MKRKWVIQEKISPEFQAQFPEFPLLILQLLSNRGLIASREIGEFLNPQYQRLTSPYLMKDMDRAVTRILEAIAKKQKIVIYADYDADAVTACTVMFRGLQALGAEHLSWYIPDRFAEGYGINIEALNVLADKGVQLIITVDCGINAIEEVQAAKARGVDVIITDHHHITGDLPQAYAVINPKRDPIKQIQGLTGVGVAFKVVQAIASLPHQEVYAEEFSWDTSLFPKIHLNTGIIRLPAHWEKWLLDLVAIGTIADCQSLIGENRILVHFGLKVLQKTRWPGLKVLLQNAGADTRKPDAFTCGFIIAPRLNAAGRIQHADIAFRLLATEDLGEAGMYAGQLESLNAHRQRLTEQIFSEAKSQVELQGSQKMLLVLGQNWPKGVVGLVASRLVEAYWRPAVVLEHSGGIATGSARSIGNFNIVEAFAQHRSHLVRFGGHAQAAGLTIEVDKIPQFHQQLLAFAERSLEDDDLIPVESIDAVAEASQLNLEFVKSLSMFEPFGPGNPAPRFLMRSVTVEGLRPVGVSGKHVKLELTQNGKIIHAIAFGQAERYRGISTGSRLDVIVEPSVNSWNGKNEVQAKIIDFLPI